MANHTPYGADWFIKRGLQPPTSTAHGTEDAIRENLKPLKTWDWTLEGNQLKCETDQGKLSQTIPTDYICLGTDDNGMPILKKIEV